jgi:hypothetical protein
MPVFKIICNDFEIDSPSATYCKIEGDGFDADWAVRSYDINWAVSPKIKRTEQYRNGQFFMFYPSELQEDTNYVILVTLRMKDYPEVNDTLSY